MKINREEIARDLMGFGSIPFLILVLVRIAMVGNLLEMFHIVGALMLLGVISRRVKGIHFHTARIVILVVFTSVFYEDYYYAVFAGLIGIAAVFGFIKYLKKEKVILSLILGALCCIASYLISIPLNIPNI